MLLRQRQRVSVNKALSQEQLEQRNVVGRRRVLDENRQRPDGHAAANR
jgi:hypothetical protein